jgi:hypothetical protein
MLIAMFIFSCIMASKSILLHRIAANKIHTHTQTHPSHKYTSLCTQREGTVTMAVLGVAVSFERQSRYDVHRHEFLEQQFAGVRNLEGRNILGRLTVLAPNANRKYNYKRGHRCLGIIQP